MSVLVYTESENGKLKKVAFECVSYAKAIANDMGTTHLQDLLLSLWSR